MASPPAAPASEAPPADSAAALAADPTLGVYARLAAPSLHALLPAEAGITLAAVAAALAPPPKPELGDLAFPTFALAKPLRRPPPALANELAQQLRAHREADPACPIVDAIAAGPYVNLRVDPALAGAALLPPLAAAPTAPTPRPELDTVMVEYSQPNTHKAFHVGHMRNVSLGDALVRLLRAAGHRVIAANYLGDVGAHIAKCLWWYLDRLTDAEREPPAEHRGEWLGGLYVRATLHLEDLEQAAKAGDERAAAQLAAARARTTDILQRLEARDPELTRVWEETRAWSLADFDAIYGWSDVHFDRVFFESEVDEPGLALVQEYLDKGVFITSEGAVGVMNEEIKHMPFFMLRKRDGTSLYATKDLALARLKFSEFAVDRSIYVVDSRQSDHFRHVFATLRKMGFAQADKCVHVPYEMVELPSGAMSSRRGTVISFRTLRETMERTIVEQYLDKYRGEWSDAEIAAVAREIALGAIKYGMLNRDVNQKIVFDLDAWLKLEGNTGPYLQYTATRAASVVRKTGEDGKHLDPQLLEGADADADAARARACAALITPEERELMVTLDQLGRVVAQAAAQLRPHLLCAYLHDLAKAFNRFVLACNVKHQTGDLLQGRLLLVAATHGALVRGLALLGIPAPARL
jgi:arginyl-tRNA synthetase